jgi:hypothetical protein
VQRHKGVKNATENAVYYRIDYTFPVLLLTTVLSIKMLPVRIENAKSISYNSPL